MHFATGMACSGAAIGVTCLVLRRGWRFIPVGMTLGGLWGILPDLPRLFREDFPSLPFASMLGRKSLEDWLHSFGDVFFFHLRLDRQPNEYALGGLFAIIGMYLGCCLMLMWLEHRQRNSLARRAFDAHGDKAPMPGPQAHPRPRDRDKHRAA